MNYRNKAKNPRNVTPAEIVAMATPLGGKIRHLGRDRSLLCHEDGSVEFVRIRHNAVRVERLITKAQLSQMPETLPNGVEIILKRCGAALRTFLHGPDTVIDSLLSRS